MKPFLYLLLSAGLSMSISSAAASEDPPPASSVSGLQLLFTGQHLNLYTSGTMLNIGRNPKAGVWNVPARKAAEMWVQRKGDSGIIRLHPHRYQRQLLELMADYPEVHNYITGKNFLYRNLDEEIPRLDNHLEKVREVRKEKQRIRPGQEQIIGR